MLHLSSGLFWLDIIPGVRVQFAPVDPAWFILARRDAQKAYGEADEDADVAAQIAFTTSLARKGIRAWEGVGDADGTVIEPTQDQIIRDGAGEIVEVIPGTISNLLRTYAAFEAIDRQYAGPQLALEAEKNASSPSRAGSSATASPTAKAAEKTAARPAKPAPSKTTRRRATRAS